MMTTEVTTTEVSGNTKPSTTHFRGRAFQLTLNDISKYESLKSEFTKLKTCDYFISCHEVAPTTGHEHIHIYAHFEQPYRLNKKIVSHGAHIEVCKGSPKQNIEYIRKDGHILDEIGNEPHQGRICTIKELTEMPKDEVPPMMYNIYTKAKAEQDNDIDIDDWAKDVKVYYIQGPSGIGKTETAKQIVRDNKDTYGTKANMLKYENNFWQGIGNAPIAIYDDFRDSHMRASEFINFIDYNRHIMNVKGGAKRNDYRLIIITSVQRLSDLYKNMQGEPRMQWERRIQLINLYNDDSDANIEDDNVNDIDII